MTGEPDEAGILPRSLDVIFNSITDVQALKYVRAIVKFVTQPPFSYAVEVANDISLTTDHRTLHVDLCLVIAGVQIRWVQWF